MTVANAFRLVSTTLGIEDPLLAFFTAFFTILASVGILHPLTNSIIRFRADYTPKSVQLDSEDGVTTQPTMGVTSIFGTSARIWKIEGFQGFYKGYMPTVAVTITSLTVVLSIIGWDGKGDWPEDTPSFSPLVNLGLSIILALISLPINVIIYRAVVTPRKLPWFNIVAGYKGLLSPTEQRRPYLIFFTPGLYLAGFLRNAIYLLGLLPLQRLLLPKLEDVPSRRADQLSLFVLAIIVSICISAPLEVIETRLAIQKYHNGSIEPEEVGNTEQVISFRSEDDPYNGLLDACDRIGREEGWYILYRAWWFDLFGSFGLLAV